MPKKKIISANLKVEKTAKQLNDEIDRIIEVAEEQNLAIGKILKKVLIKK
ncbi:MAG: hypothetical protein ACOYMF_02580 [Bacteroidales bacterium]